MTDTPAELINPSPEQLTDSQARDLLAQALAGSGDALVRLTGWDLPVLAAGAVFEDPSRAEFWAASAAYLNAVADLELFEQALETDAFDEVTLLLEAALSTLAESPLQTAALVLLAVAGAEASAGAGLVDEQLSRSVGLARQVAQTLLEAVPGFSDQALDVVEKLIAEPSGL